MKTHTYLLLLLPFLLPAMADEEKKDNKDKAIKVLLKQTMRSNSVYSISEAVIYKRPQILKARIEEGANLNEKDEYGQTPLHLAAIHKRTAMVHLLLKAGADPTLANAEGKTPIQCTKHKKIVQLLQKSLQQRQREVELLRHIESGNTQEVAKALRAKVNPNAFTQRHGETMLHFAVNKCNADIVQLLIKAGADVNKKQANGNTPMHHAAAWGRVDIAKLLIQAGADPTIATPRGPTPLLDAVWHGRAEMVKLLLPYYKDENYSPNGKGEGYPICMAISQRKEAILRHFLDAGIDVNDNRFSSEPLLILGVKTGSEEIVRMLLNAGAKANATDKDGKSARDYANSTILPLLPA